MANVGIDIVIQLQGDETSTVFSIDLEKDPYTVPAGTVNWFSQKARTFLPSGFTNGIVTSDSSGVGGGEITLASASLSGTVLTVTISVAIPNGDAAQFVGTLLFGA